MTPCNTVLFIGCLGRVGQVGFAARLHAPSVLTDDVLRARTEEAAWNNVFSSPTLAGRSGCNMLEVSKGLAMCLFAYSPDRAFDLPSGGRTPLGLRDRRRHQSSAVPAVGHPRPVLQLPVLMMRREALAFFLSTLMAPYALADTRREDSGKFIKLGFVTDIPGTLKDAPKKKPSEVEAAKAQIAEASRELDRLMANYDAVTTAYGGDGVRRVLGKVGTTSPLFQIEQALKLLFDNDPNLPDKYIEDLDAVMLGISDADGQAYSSNFVSFSSAKGKPEDYWKRAQDNIPPMQTALKEMIKFAGITP